MVEVKTFGRGEGAGFGDSGEMWGDCTSLLESWISLLSKDGVYVEELPEPKSC